MVGIIILSFLRYITFITQNYITFIYEKALSPLKKSLNLYDRTSLSINRREVRYGVIRII